MWLLRRVARSCGPILILFGVLLSFSHITLLRLLLPFRFIVAEFLVAGGLASASLVPRKALCSPWLHAIHSLALRSRRSDFWHPAVSCGVPGLPATVISFENEGAHLVGTLYIPNGHAPHAEIVIVHGSGRFPRCFYHMWADHFVRTGCAVLLYDKRGVGGSSGHYEGENNVSKGNVELLASDASAALRTLAAYPGVRSDAVGFWGVSQAGWIIPRAAALNGHAAFMIIVSGPTTTTGEQMEYSRITGEHDPGPGMTTQDAERLMSERPPTGFDPVPDLEILNIPGLWLQGDHDWRIPAIKSVRILDRLIKESNRPYTYHIFPGAGHAIFLPRKKGERLIPELAPGYWQAMDDWLTHQTNRA